MKRTKEEEEQCRNCKYAACHPDNCSQESVRETMKLRERVNENE